MFTRIAKMKENRISNADRMESHWVSHPSLVGMKNILCRKSQIYQFIF